MEEAMSIFDFTKGEWKVYINKTGWYLKAKDTDTHDVMICKSLLDSECLPETHKRQKADACLIACAPEMLKTLIDIIKTWYVYVEDGELRIQAIEKEIKLIEKATGKSWDEIGKNT
jgi:hypothetical protein